MFPHRSGYYLKSVLHPGPQADVMKDVFKKVSELNGAPGNEIKYTMLFEYFPHRKLLSVPADATAHVRSASILVGCALKWDSNTPGIEQIAKRTVGEVIDIITADTQLSDANNAGYGNFSKCLKIPSHIYVARSTN
jgi:hypothetical protein